MASVAVDLGVPFVTGLSGCGPWGPFHYWPQWLWDKLFSSLSSCGTVLFSNLSGGPYFVSIGPSAAAVAVDLWVYFIILCGCLTGVSVIHFLYVFLQMSFIMVFGRKSYAFRTRS